MSRQKSKDQAARLETEVSLQRIAEARGVQLEQQCDGHLLGRCPFHEDEPGHTLMIDPNANTWTCSACATSGSLIDWVMKSEGVSRAHAIELLKADKLTGNTSGLVKKSSTKKLDLFPATDEADQVVLGRVIEFYAETLRASSEAQDYLKHRKLDSPELIQHFKLGYSNRTLGYRLPDRNRRAGAALRGQLERLGVFRASGHEHLSGSLVVPILDEAGGVADIHGRKITAGLRAGTPQHLTLGEGPKHIFNLGGVHDHEVILCKSVLDALSFWAAGHKNAITTFGLHGFTDLHRQAFKQHDIKKVLIAFDRSKKGDAATEQLGDELARSGLQVFRVVFPWGMDANDFLRAGEPFDELVRAAQWMGGTRSTVVTEAIITPKKPATVSKPETVTPSSSEASVPPPVAEPMAHHQAVEIAANEVVMRFGSRSWRVRGHEGCTSLASIRINIRVATDYGFFSDTLDILSARARASFLKQAREELELEERILKADLGHVVLRVEELVDAALRERLEPKKPTHIMGDAERDEAMALLRDPQIVERIVTDFDKCGIVGEHDNKLIGYLATVSRRLDEPLAVVIQSSSAAGKSSLLDAVLRFVPDEEQVAYSAMTGQSLFYMGGMDLKHKVLAIAEEAGAHQAAYALRVLQSSGELSIASTGKDQQTGRLSAHEYRVQGPVAILMTTTALDVDDELLNRCLVLTVDESPEQTAAIQELQRQARTLGGLLDRRARLDVERLHQNAQRLLVPLSVVNPFAPELTFSTGTTRSRRDQKKLLTLIDTIAFLHQHQRLVRTVEVGTGTIKYIEVSKADIELAVKLSRHLFGHGTEDVPPQTGNMLMAIKAMVTKAATEQVTDPQDVRFTRRQLRERFGWGERQTRVHLDRLTELEYVVRHRGGQGRSFLYSMPTDTTPTSWGVVGASSGSKDEVFSKQTVDLSELRPPSGKVHQGNGSEKSYRSRTSESR